MYTKLLAKLNQLVLLNPPQKRSLCQALKQEDLPQDTVLLEAGDVCDRIYFVTEGILRASCQIDGKDITRWFCFEEHFAAAYFSFVYQKPSEDTIALVTDAKLLSLTRSALQTLCQQDNIWVDLNRHLLEQYYISSLDRIMSFQTQSTAERYQSLLSERPTIEDEVPLGQLASYLGMSKETLSRLRKKKK
ncbi:MAG: Crp/Fnr family transcriptional regulator [Cyanobacteria bacterium P01_F01_bin.53]